ncbi:MAG: cellulose biosynthesis cyclic di-GMP-binding regulatory protein BcsB [Sinimarinibacterium flocculans]|uniref:cellulose biosynthesis cyclic di-GMP-binding regulatory protein BcsB n=1 Tax=Sinimarinibacterium flocculans TaxID=985250 RepID=UPI003C666097
MSIHRAFEKAAMRTLCAGLLLAAGAQAAIAQAPAGEREVELRFEDLGVDYPIRLRTVFGQASLPLDLRANEIVTRAELELRIAHSPSLRFDLSHLSVAVNDQIIWTRPLEAADASGKVVTIPLDPLLLVSRNQIRFDFVAHYAKEGECEDPTHSTLWADISNDSVLRLSLRTLDLPPTLEKMPAPWFDAAERGRLRLPFVLPGDPGLETVRAAGIVAAWFGAQADYRGADFPVQFGAAPAGHAVLFQLGGTEPALRAIRNPGDADGRLLVFSAPDEAGLVQLAQGFALGHVLMRGDSARLTRIELPPPQAAWASRRWPALDRPFALEPYLLGPSTVAGLAPGPIVYEFALPPDVFFLGRSGAFVDLDYRASRAGNPKSSLNLLLNGQYLGSTLLDAGGERRAETESRALDVEVPPQLLRGNNRLVAQFEFLRDTSKACEDFRAATLQGGIDPRSALKIARHAHFAEMPALEKLVNGGFPYSKFADLSQTALALPENPTEAEVSAALIVLGHIGRWTQDAATRVEVLPLSVLDEAVDRDLVLIAPAGAATLPPALDEAGVLKLHADGAELRTASSLAALQGRIEGRLLRDAERVAARVLVQSGGALGSLQQFESPWQRGRSIVALRTTAAADPRDVALALTDPGRNQYIEGGLVLVTPQQVSGYRVGDSYGVGRLPWWYALTRWMRHHPYLLVPLALAIALLFAAIASRLLRRHAAGRQPKTGA